MTFNIITFGCKVNAYESEFMKEQLLNNNFKYEKSYKNSDIVIINTCSVTNEADNKCFRKIRSVRRDNPACIMVVCGCSAENHRDNLPDIYIDILIGNREKSQIVSLIKNYLITNKTYEKFYDDRSSVFEDMKVNAFEDKTRAFVKIQDGCNNFCAYCIIPYVRGNIRSKEINKCVEEIKELVLNGHKEIVFTGIDTGNYGRETGKYNLVDLIRLVSEIPELERIRVSSIEITSIDDEFIDELNKIEGINSCASIGILNDEQAKELVKHGLKRFHHNINTAESYYNQICTTHSWQDRYNTCKLVKKYGMELCCGVILGMGESIEQRVEMALELAQIQPESIPINILMPIPKTPFENYHNKIDEENVLRTLAVFKIANPKSVLRFCGGRMRLSNENQELALKTCVEGIMTGNYLTTTGKSPKEDMETVIKLNKNLKRN